eukprot:GHVH01001564.1.p1 GENE.GHVH01001564.1~~GHVH01001564.1.p1  ORF type:complete len:2322 (-),score=271.95 GHVH01001564.1:71-7036(-)
MTDAVESAHESDRQSAYERVVVNLPHLPLTELDKRCIQPRSLLEVAIDAIAIQGFDGISWNQLLLTLTFEYGRYGRYALSPEDQQDLYEQLNYHPDIRMIDMREIKGSLSTLIEYDRPSFSSINPENEYMNLSCYMDRLFSACLIQKSKIEQLQPMTECKCFNCIQEKLRWSGWTVKGSKSKVSNVVIPRQAWPINHAGICTDHRISECDTDSITHCTGVSCGAFHGTSTSGNSLTQGGCRIRLLPSPMLVIETLRIRYQPEILSGGLIRLLILSKIAMTRRNGSWQYNLAKELNTDPRAIFQHLKPLFMYNKILKRILPMPACMRSATNLSVSGLIWYEQFSNISDMASMIQQIVSSGEKEILIDKIVTYLKNAPGQLILEQELKDHCYDLFAAPGITRLFCTLKTASKFYLKIRRTLEAKGICQRVKAWCHQTSKFEFALALTNNGQCNPNPATIKDANTVKGETHEPTPIADRRDTLIANDVFLQGGGSEDEDEGEGDDDCSSLVPVKSDRFEVLPSSEYTQAAVPGQLSLDISLNDTSASDLFMDGDTNEKQSWPAYKPDGITLIDEATGLQLRSNDLLFKYSKHISISRLVLLLIVASGRTGLVTPLITAILGLGSKRLGKILSNLEIGHHVYKTAQRQGKYFMYRYYSSDQKEECTMEVTPGQMQLLKKAVNHVSGGGGLSPSSLDRGDGPAEVRGLVGRAIAENVKDESPIMDSSEGSMTKSHSGIDVDPMLHGLKMVPMEGEKPFDIEGRKRLRVQQGRVKAKSHSKRKTATEEFSRRVLLFHQWLHEPPGAMTIPDLAKKYSKSERTLNGPDRKTIMRLAEAIMQESGHHISQGRLSLGSQDVLFYYSQKVFPSSSEDSLDPAERAAQMMNVIIREKRSEGCKEATRRSLGLSQSMMKKREGGDHKTELDVNLSSFDVGDNIKGMKSPLVGHVHREVSAGVLQPIIQSSLGEDGRGLDALHMSNYMMRSIAFDQRVLSFYGFISPVIIRLLHAQKYIIEFQMSRLPLVRSKLSTMADSLDPHFYPPLVPPPMFLENAEHEDYLYFDIKTLLDEMPLEVFLMVIGCGYALDYIDEYLTDPHRKSEVTISKCPDEVQGRLIYSMFTNSATGASRTFSRRAVDQSLRRLLEKLERLGLAVRALTSCDPNRTERLTDIPFGKIAHDFRTSEDDSFMIVWRVVRFPIMFKMIGGSTVRNPPQPDIGSFHRLCKSGVIQVDHTWPHANEMLFNAGGLYDPNDLRPHPLNDQEPGSIPFSELSEAVSVFDMADPSESDQFWGLLRLQVTQWDDYIFQLQAYQKQVGSVGAANTKQMLPSNYLHSSELFNKKNWATNSLSSTPPLLRRILNALADALVLIGTGTKEFLDSALDRVSQDTGEAAHGLYPLNQDMRGDATAVVLFYWRLGIITTKDFDLNVNKTLVVTPSSVTIRKVEALLVNNNFDVTCDKITRYILRYLQHKKVLTSTTRRSSAEFGSDTIGGCSNVLSSSGVLTVDQAAHTSLSSSYAPPQDHQISLERCYTGGPQLPIGLIVHMSRDIKYRCHLCGVIYNQRRAIKDHYSNLHGGLPQETSLYCLDLAAKESFKKTRGGSVYSSSNVRSSSKNHTSSKVPANSLSSWKNNLTHFNHDRLFHNCALNLVRSELLTPHGPWQPGISHLRSPETSRKSAQLAEAASIRGATLPNAARCAPAGRRLGTLDNALEFLNHRGMMVRYKFAAHRPTNTDDSIPNEDQSAKTLRMFLISRHSRVLLFGKQRDSYLAQLANQSSILSPSSGQEEFDYNGSTLIKDELLNGHDVMYIFDELSKGSGDLDLLWVSADDPGRGTPSIPVCEPVRPHPVSNHKGKEGDEEEDETRGSKRAGGSIALSGINYYLKFSTIPRLFGCVWSRNETSSLQQPPHVQLQPPIPYKATRRSKWSHLIVSDTQMNHHVSLPIKPPTKLGFSVCSDLPGAVTHIANIGDIEPPDPNLFNCTGSTGAPYEITQPVYEDPPDVPEVITDYSDDLIINVYTNMCSLLDIPIDWLNDHHITPISSSICYPILPSMLITGLAAIYRQVHLAVGAGIAPKIAIVTASESLAVLDDESSLAASQLLIEPINRSVKDLILHRSSESANHLRCAFDGLMMEEDCNWGHFIIYVLIVFRLIGRIPSVKDWLLFAFSAADPEFHTLTPMNEISLREYSPLTVKYHPIKDFPRRSDSTVLASLWVLYGPQNHILGDQCMLSHYYRAQTLLIEAVLTIQLCLWGGDMLIKPLMKDRTTNSLYTSIDGNLNLELIHRIPQRLLMLMKYHPGITVGGITKRLGFLFPVEVRELINLLLAKGYLSH